MKLFNNHVLIDVVNESKGGENKTIDEKSVVLHYPCSSKSTCTPYRITLGTGVYQFECWGARGEGRGAFGYGAYTSGFLRVYKRSTYYVYIGATGSFNCIPGEPIGGRSGGGSTDVRLSFDDTWHNVNSLLSRIMVAAGGAGAEWPNSVGGSGGAPDGENGITATTNTANAPVFPDPTYGATNAKGGYCDTTYTVNDIARQVFQGTFGVAGYSSTSADLGGIGGGGFFGGATPDYGGGGSGGSSYISGNPHCKSVKNSATITPSSSPIHFSGIKFVNSMMIAGNSQMPLPQGGIGKWDELDGKFKLTLLSSDICSASLQRKSKISILALVCLMSK